VLSALESAELTVAGEDDLMDIGDDRRPKLRRSSTDMGSFWLSLRKEYPIITKKATEALRPFCTSYLCETGFSVVNRVAASNTGGVLEDMLANNPTSEKRHHEVSPSTGFPLIVLCLHKNFSLLLTFILKDFFLNPIYVACK
jgi:hypothetical protein